MWGKWLCYVTQKYEQVSIIITTTYLTPVVSLLVSYLANLWVSVRLCSPSYQGPQEGWGVGGVGLLKSGSAEIFAKDPGDLSFYYLEL